MTDIRFMDEISAPRRSMYPSQEPPVRDPSEIGLAEYVVAVDVEIPELELYSNVSNDLAAWIDRSKEVYKQAEAEAAKVTPELFVEFREADEIGKAELVVSGGIVVFLVCVDVSWHFLLS
jgi:kinetochore protein Spc7/SPC105